MRMVIDLKYQLIFLKWTVLMQNKRKVPKPEFFTFEEMDIGNIRVMQAETPNKIESNHHEFYDEVLKIIHRDYNNWGSLLLEKTKEKDKKVGNEDKKLMEEKKLKEEEKNKRNFDDDDRIETNGDIASKDHNLLSFGSLVKPKKFIPNYNDSVKQYL